MLALTQTTDKEYYSRAMNEDCVNGGPWTRTKYVYDGHENLKQVVDAANPDLIYWQATSVNAFGQLTGELLGNGVINIYGFDPNTGALLTFLSGVGSNPGVANMNYQWDDDGNLHLRTDNNAGLTETFQYDSLNRLTQAQITGNSNSTLTLNYDAVGNIQSKSDVGTYNYNDPNHPQQISSLTPNTGPTRNFSYDPNGNLVNDGVHINSFDALNRVTAIQDSGANAAVQFSYTPDGARYQETTTVGASATTLTEVNALFEVQASSISTAYREMIVGGTGIVAIRTVQDNGILTTRYLTGDHLGSVSEITNEVGSVIERMSYAAFGERRNPTTWQPYATVPDLTDITDKGYTGQQQLDAVGLIHMNGRVYDPQIGRFISADPTIPDPFDSQSFNRYAYVYNNPLNATDPSGMDPCQWTMINGQCVIVLTICGDSNSHGQCNLPTGVGGPDKSGNSHNSNSSSKSNSSSNSLSKTGNSNGALAPGETGINNTSGPCVDDSGSCNPYGVGNPWNNNGDWNGLLPTSAGCGVACGQGWANWDGQVFGGSLGGTGLKGPPKDRDGNGGAFNDPGPQPKPDAAKVPYHPAGGGSGPTVGANPVPGSVGNSSGVKSHWFFGGDFVGKPNLSASGLAAWGSGFDVEKGIYNADSSINFVTVAVGLSASLNTNLITVTYQGTAVNPLGLTQGFGVSGEYNYILGGQIQILFIPPSTFQFSFNLDLGAGLGFHVYSIGKDFPGG